MFRSMLTLGSVVALAAAVAAPAHSDPPPKGPNIQHIVVIYEENHSFDNIFGGWEGVNGLEGVTAQPQVDRNGEVLPCLPQNDPNLTSPPVVPVVCSLQVGSNTVNSAFVNNFFRIDDHIKPEDTTCPKPGAATTGTRNGTGDPGGCTRDLVHKFYQEQYQIDGGKQDRYVTGSDALGLAMGVYDTKQLPIYKYLHSAGAPHYAIADNFFQAAFGGSFLNHQWLITPYTPTWPAPQTGGPDDQHSVVGPDGYPAGTALHPQTNGTKDAALTHDTDEDGSCKVTSAGAPPAGTVCGDYAVNTIQPVEQPYRPGTKDEVRLPLQTHETIGDRLSAANVSWAWYSGGWSNANGDVGAPGWTNGNTPGTCQDPNAFPTATYPNCPDLLFQFHHQPFNYFSDYAPGTHARKVHLRDEEEFIAAAKSGDLRRVSFVKPIGAENEHPGYASEHAGSSHLVELLEAIENGPDADSTLVVVTYDEFGGQWDHVPPPTAAGISDKWGPGTRIPALLISPQLEEPFAVDKTEHDTTSIMATIERRFGLHPLGTRDAAVEDLLQAALFSGNRP